jgi:hypothetical protein
VPTEQYKTAKVRAELMRRLKAQAVLHQTTVQDVVADALEPVVSRMERETFSRFSKESEDKTRARK